MNQLPTAATFDPQSAPAIEAATQPGASRPKLRVLIADDHSLVRIGVIGTLARSDRYEVCGEAVDGLDCLAQVEALRPELLLLDILMPRLSGLEAVARVRAVSPATRILFLSSQESHPAVMQAMQAGADGFLSKDVVLAELLEAMDDALAVRRYLSPRIAGVVARATDGARTAMLTERQVEVLRGVARGMSNKQIARELEVSPKTIEFHRAQLMNRLNLHDVASLTRYALEAGLLV